MSRPTPSEVRWPMDDESRQQAEQWAGDATAQVIDWTWRGFDALKANMLSQVDFSQPLEQVERDLTSKHFVEIQRIFGSETDGFSSIIPHHEFPENETRPGGCGKPPASDISFVWYENQRVTWPIEAKVIPTTGTLAEYLKDTAKFTGGVSAPFVGEGAQIAYLLNGTTDKFFSNLNAGKLITLQEVTEFSNRPHRVSFHTRSPAPNLRLHHMAMFCGSNKEDSLRRLEQ